MSKSTECPVTVASTRPRIAAPAVTRLGLIALSTDLTIEGDGRRLLPEAAALHVTRVEFANPTTPENLALMEPRLSTAAGLLAPCAPLSAIGFGCTSGSAVIGDAEIAAAIGESYPGIPVMTPTLAVRRALARLGLSRLAVLTPYLPQTTTSLIGYFEAGGVEVVAAHCLGFEDDRDMARIAADDLCAAARAADHPQAEALFLSCTALPAVPLIARIEADLGKPVLCSNQALYWALMDLAGVPMPRGFGRIFDPVPA